MCNSEMSHQGWEPNPRDCCLSENGTGLASDAYPYTRAFGVTASRRCSFV